MKKTLIISGLILVVFGLGIYLFIQDSKYNTSNTNSEELEAMGQEFPIQGRNHIEIGEAHDPYSTNPPTSGSHYTQPAVRAVYQEVLPDEQLIHNLEHGEIWISFKEIDADTLGKLETIARNNTGSVIMTPRPANDAKIVLASWGRLEQMDVLDEAKVLEFIRRNKNKSPEPLAK